MDGHPKGATPDLGERWGGGKGGRHALLFLIAYRTVPTTQCALHIHGAWKAGLEPQPTESRIHLVIATRRDGELDLPPSNDKLLFLVVSQACERRQPLALRATGEPRDLRGDLAST